MKKHRPTLLEIQKLLTEALGFKDLSLVAEAQLKLIAIIDSIDHDVFKKKVKKEGVMKAYNERLSEIFKLNETA